MPLRACGDISCLWKVSHVEIYGLLCVKAKFPFLDIKYTEKLHVNFKIGRKSRVFCLHKFVRILFTNFFTRKFTGKSLGNSVYANFCQKCVGNFTGKRQNSSSEHEKVFAKY